MAGTQPPEQGIYLTAVDVNPLGHGRKEAQHLAHRRASGVVTRSQTGVVKTLKRDDRVGQLQPKWFVVVRGDICEFARIKRAQTARNRGA